MTGECGGATGMMFFINERGERFYMGGMTSDAELVTTALNATIELLERG
ncbi:MAG: hypothetical protein QOI98_3128 [Solirubrobacteraceae bacterium]|nr:hypothetical protein [Solirubrobacteraceae bacterium]